MDKYYNTEKHKSLTYLEFGSINIEKGEKCVWDFRVNQDAYDLFMFARYSKELISYKRAVQLIKENKFEEFGECYLNDIHTKDFLNTIFTWTAITYLYENVTQSPTFFELGSTIFGCIEAYEAWRSFSNNGPLVTNVLYGGLEISSLLQEMGELLHPRYLISTYLNERDIPSDFSLFFAKGVSLLYAINKAEQLFDYLNRSSIAIFDYNFSLDTQKGKMLGTGKFVYHLDYASFRKLSKESRNKLYLRRSDAQIDIKGNLARCSFIWGEPSMVKDILQKIAKELSHFKDSIPLNIYTLLTNGYYFDPRDDYVRADEYLEPYLCNEKFAN